MRGWQVPFIPKHPGERPTLGWLVLDWIIANLAAPDSPAYKPFTPTREQAEFILKFYELDPIAGRRIVRRGVISRPRGWGKSPFVAALCWVEALGPVLFEGWDAHGRPVGKPWSSVRTPLVALSAVSEFQTVNSWGPVIEMAEGPVVDNYPGVEPYGGYVLLPSGYMTPLTASKRSVKGFKPVFNVCDQTEEWDAGIGGRDLAKTIRDNASKLGGTTIETPNAYTVGAGSVAEETATAYRLIQEGKAKPNPGLLYDHREAPADTDVGDVESLRLGLRTAYGDSSDDPRGCVLHEPPCSPGWSPIQRFIEDALDADLDVLSFRGNFLNQIGHASDAYLSEPTWAGCRAKPEIPSPQPGEQITLGFDGSRGRARGKPDATALVACRVSDGYVWPIHIWEADENRATWETWEPPLHLIDSVIRETFNTYDVVAFYADPARDWRSHVGAWEAEFGDRVKVKVKAAHPFEWWMSGGRSSFVQLAVEAFEGAVRNRDLTHDGSSHLMRHVLNARRRTAHGKLILAKANDYSPNKIDGCIAAVLAWQARLDAIAAGVLHATPELPALSFGM